MIWSPVAACVWILLSMGVRHGNETPSRLDVAYICPLGLSHRGSAKFGDGMLIVSYRGYQKSGYIGRTEPRVHARRLLRLLVIKADKDTLRTSKTSRPVAGSKL